MMMHGFYLISMEPLLFFFLFFKKYIWKTCTKGTFFEVRSKDGPGQ